MRFEEKARALTWLADLSLTGLGELLLKPKRCIAPAAGAVIALPGASEKLNSSLFRSGNSKIALEARGSEFPGRCRRRWWAWEPAS